MRSVARQGEDPHPERDLPAEVAGLIGAAAVLHARILALVTTMAAGTTDGDVILELAGAGARLGENSAGLREVASALADAAAAQFCVAQAHASGLATGAALAAVPDAPGRHRKGRVPHPRIPGERPLMLRVVRVLIPAAAGAWGALKLAASHGRAHVALTAHTARIAAMTTGGTGVAAVLTVAAVHTMSPVAAHPGRYAGPSPSAPAASAWSASRMSSSPPAAPVAHGGVDANRAGPAGIVPLAPWSPPPSSAPPAVAPTPTPSAGQLALSSVTADLSSGQQVTITLYALGGDVTWHAWCGGQDVTLSAGSGTAAPGVPSLLVFSAAPAQDGAVVARCHVWPGGYSVSVLLPIPPSPSPSASPSPAPAITDTPTPDPSSS